MACMTMQISQVTLLVIYQDIYDKKDRFKSNKIISKSGFHISIYIYVEPQVLFYHIWSTLLTSLTPFY